MEKPKIISCSLPKELFLLMKRRGISPSRILQEQLKQILAYESGELLETTASLSQKIERMSKTIHSFAEFLEEKGLQNEYLQKNGY